MPVTVICLGQFVPACFNAAWAAVKIIRNTALLSAVRCNSFRSVKLTSGLNIVQKKGRSVKLLKARCNLIAAALKPYLVAWEVNCKSWHLCHANFQLGCAEHATETAKNDIGSVVRGE